MNNLYTILEAAGISPSEKKIYEFGRRFSEPLPSQAITSGTALPRQTVLAGLQGLRTIGLCTAIRHDGRSLRYEMQSIGELKAHFAKKTRHINGILEQIDIIEQPLTETTQSINGSGQEKLIRLLDHALHSRERYWRIIAPHNNALRYLPNAYITYFKKTRLDKEITGQTLWEWQFKNKEIPLLQTLRRKPRYVPKGKKQPLSLMLSYDESLLTISGTDNPSFVRITDVNIIQTFNTLFDLAWESCRKD